MRPIVFKGHLANFKVMWLKKIDFDPNLVLLDCNSSLNSPMATKWCTKLDIALKMCPIFLKVDCQISRSQGKQGKSEGFESCDRPIVWQRPIWVKIGDVLYRVTLKFDGWPWKTIMHLSYAVSSFVQHFIAMGEFKLELQSGNAQSGSNSMIFRAVWPWNLTDDLEN